MILAATLGAAALTTPATANADQTAGIPGFNCSVTAYTPTPYLNGENALAGVSCGGGQVSYSKDVQAQLMQLLPGGWSVVATSPWSGWSGINPQQVGEIAGPCVPGRWYATVAQGIVNHGGLQSSSSANTYGSGRQCH
jgi:hypothetical protein